MLSRFVEVLWTLAATSTGWLHRARPETWRPIGGGTVLVVSPHPDDETLGSGGVLIRHRQAGDRVVVLQVTDGRGSRAGGLGPEEMAARRTAEAVAAASRLGVELMLMALPEGGWQEATLTDLLRDQLEALTPDVVYAPSPVDYHPEHAKVARALAAALGDDRRPLIRVWEIGVPLTATLTNLVASVSSVEPVRQAALAAYVTQVGPLRTVARQRRYNGAFWGLDGSVECFWQLKPSAYRAVVAAGDWSGRSTPFVGARQHALGDPLSYLRGAAERRRLARVAAWAHEG